MLQISNILKFFPSLQENFFFLMKQSKENLPGPCLNLQTYGTAMTKVRFALFEAGTLCACSGFPRILSLLRVCLSFFPPLFSCSPFVPAFDLFHLALCFSFFSFPHPTTAGSQARGVLGQPWDNPDRGVSVLTWDQEKE